MDPYGPPTGYPPPLTQPPQGFPQAPPPGFPPPWAMPQMRPPGPMDHSQLAQMLLASVKPTQKPKPPAVDLGRLQGALGAFGSV